MPARWVTALLLVLLVVVQGQIWFGRASVAQVRRQTEELQQQELANARARERNARLAAEVEDLRTGLETVEEIARHELGLVKPNEVYIHIQGDAAIPVAPPVMAERTGPR
jgi:cell division protein FtsB